MLSSFKFGIVFKENKTLSIFLNRLLLTSKRSNVSK